MTVTSERPDAATLCVSCGLCCNGVLYSRARAEPEEVERLEAAGLVVDQTGDALKFRLPCHYYRERCCTIYPDRFTKCRTYRCSLLRRLDAGEVSLPEALGTVSQAKEMVERVTALDPALAMVANRLALRRMDASPQEKENPVTARHLVESIALDMFFDRSFRNAPTVEVHKVELSGADDGTA